MFDPKKKKGLDVMIAVGKPGAGKGGPPDLSAPGPLERDQKPPQPGDDDSLDDEASETPQEEGNEEYGAKLLNDATKPLMDRGMSEDDAKSALADIFGALAKCLQGGGEDDAGEGMDDQPGGAPMGRSPYGR